MQELDVRPTPPDAAGTTPAADPASAADPQEPVGSADLSRSWASTITGTFFTTTQFLGRTVLSCATVLMFWSALPLTFGWQSCLIVSGSMLPGIIPGDVVIAQPAVAEDLLPGQVIVINNPARPGTLLVHRMVRRRTDGRLITKGDANPAEDSTPVPPDHVRGLARLRVPYIGLPVLWLRDHMYGQLGVFLAVLGAVVIMAGGRGSHAEPEPPTGPRHASGGGRPPYPVPPGWREGSFQAGLHRPGPGRYGAQRADGVLEWPHTPADPADGTALGPMAARLR